MQRSCMTLGKSVVDDQILKKPGHLTDKEYYEMQRHALHTRRILNRIHLSDKYRDLPQLAGCHHERLDGSGYPEGLTEAEIPLMARILAVADVFDAVTCWREYREPMSGPEAFQLIKQGIGKQFDGTVVASLERFYQRTNLEEAIQKDVKKVYTDRLLMIF